MIGMDTVVTLTNLQESENSLAGAVIEARGHFLEMKLAQPVGVGSPVKVEANDTISLGEVSYCSPAGDGYIVGVDLMEALHNVAELSRLARALLS